MIFRIEVAPNTGASGLISATTGVTVLGDAPAAANRFEVIYEPGTASRTIEPLRGAAPKDCSGFEGAGTFGHYTESGTPKVLAGGAVEWEQELVFPGAGGDWEDVALLHVLRSRMADALVPDRATDTLTGVSTTRVKPANPGDWDVGSVGVCTLNGSDYPFYVTGRQAGGGGGDHDLSLMPGLPSIVDAATAVRLAQRLYWQSGAEGDELVVWVHEEETLWVGTVCRLATISGRIADDGRLMIKNRLEVGQWTADHSNTDPYCDDGPCTCPTGAAALAENIKARISSAYCGTGGTLTSAPWISASIADLVLKDFTFEVTWATQVAKGRDRRVGIRDIRSTSCTTKLTAVLVEGHAVTTFDLDPFKRGKRPGVLCIGPAGNGAGLVLIFPGLKLDKLPDDMAATEAGAEQTLSWISGGACLADASPSDGVAAAGVNAGGFMVGLVAVE